MVRLKRNPDLNKCKTNVESLNSTMVRLKPFWDLMKFYLPKLKSQFHYGSIKTVSERCRYVRQCSGLNSTMVRLKRVVNKRKDGTRLLSLNSTMVRLKQTLTHWENCYNQLSQFHYGSIKTILQDFILMPYVGKSQFHYGSIKTWSKKTIS